MRYLKLLVSAVVANATYTIGLTRGAPAASAVSYSEWAEGGFWRHGVSRSGSPYVWSEYSHSSQIHRSSVCMNGVVNYWERYCSRPGAQNPGQTASTSRSASRTGNKAFYRVCYGNNEAARVQCEYYPYSVDHEWRNLQ